MTRLVHETRPNGWHRIVIYQDATKLLDGEWVSYNAIAYITTTMGVNHTPRLFAVVTSYHGVEMFGMKADTIYEVTTLTDVQQETKHVD